MAKTKVIICPYCGDTQSADDRCRACGGFFEPLSRQATHNDMGPWFIRDENRPFQPGCSYETIVKLVERGLVTRYTILRGPTTKQFWTVARRVPGVAHLLGYCHNCDASVDVGDHGCHACGVPFGAYLDRNYLGLPEVRPLPWEAPAEEAALPQTAPSREMDFRRAAEPLGISSFASDAELRGGGVSPMPAYGPLGAHGGAAGQAGTQVAELSIPARPGPAVPALSTIAVHAAQRRVDQLQRTIRWLAVGLVAATAIVVAVVAIMMITRSVPETDQSTKAPPSTPVEQREPPAPTNTASAPPEVPPAVANPDIEGPLARGRELIEAARQEDRTIEERLRDYEEAQRTLKELAGSFAPEQMPVAITELLQQVQKEMDDLRLKAYFP